MIKLGVFFIMVSVVSLFIGFYVALSATRDCDLSDIVLIISLPGFILALLGLVLIFYRNGFSIKSSHWVCLFFLLVGFVALGFERSYINTVTAETCD